MAPNQQDNSHIAFRTKTEENSIAHKFVPGLMNDATCKAKENLYLKNGTQNLFGSDEFFTQMHEFYKTICF